MKKIHFYRGEIIMLNTFNDKGKWTVYELNLYADSLDEIKNKIDKNLGGYATNKKPKRAYRCKSD
ncbi:hypothetical protein [Siminovitchia sp. 179-K 8D1 HS]|uniref:hypothetical protein n=1 Tax=Siminovitchia sp. 179-K 8D1 HS TaxID=3142385 RepID=UPI00399FEFF6